jgi:hypothetical protein
MTDKKKSGWLPPKVAKFLKYCFAFIVTFAVGISPVLVSKTTGYTAILDLFPERLRGVTIPWAAFLFSVTAIGVQFFNRTDITDRHLKRAFAAIAILLVPAVFVLFFCYEATVIRVYVPGADTTVSYLVGSTLLPTCECAKRGLDIRDCIASSVTVNPYDVEKCYPRQEITTNGAVLSMLYMFVMFALGTLIGLLVLRRPHRTHRAVKAAAAA